MTVISRIKPSRQAEMSWHVIDMARKDGPRSLNPDGLVARIMRTLFGMPVPRRLSNDGLEALRRFSVRAWYWDFVPAREVQGLLAAGYSVADAERILAYVAHHRGFTPSLLLSHA
jgi:hypothetical protein